MLKFLLSTFFILQFLLSQFARTKGGANFQVLTNFYIEKSCKWIQHVLFDAIVNGLQ